VGSAVAAARAPQATVGVDGAFGERRSLLGIAEGAEAFVTGERVRRRAEAVAQLAPRAVPTDGVAVGVRARRREGDGVVPRRASAAPAARRGDQDAVLGRDARARRIIG